MADFDAVTARFMSAMHPDSNESHAFREAAAVAGMCAACVQVLPVQHAAISIAEDGAGLQLWAASDHIAAAVETVQATLAQGPAIDAFTHGAAVFVPDLTNPSKQWLGFADAVAGAGVSGAMAALPLQIGAARLGVLDLYCDNPGPLDPDAVAAALHIAGVMTTLLLTTPGSAGDDAVLPGWDLSLTSRVIHQAAGMVIAQLRLTPSDAYARLRAHAYTHGQSLAEVADLVTTRQLRFDPDTD